MSATFSFSDQQLFVQMTQVIHDGLVKLLVVLGKNSVDAKEHAQELLQLSIRYMIVSHFVKEGKNADTTYLQKGNAEEMMTVFFQHVEHIKTQDLVSLFSESMRDVMDSYIKDQLITVTAQQQLEIQNLLEETAREMVAVIPAK